VGRFLNFEADESSAFEQL